MSHTPEPWETVNDHVPVQLKADDYNHAVRCVNACAGINPLAVPALAEALKNLIPLWDISQKIEDYQAEFQQAKQALALAQETQP